MTKITRKLLLSIITVVLTVVALGTTTFAWFTLTNTASLQSFEAEIIADSGIEIAIGDEELTANQLGLNWVTTLTTAAIEDYIDAAYSGTFQFNHVTSTDGIAFRTLGIGAQGNTVFTGFLELPIHFRSNTANAIDWTGVTLGSTEFIWTADQSFNSIGYNSVSGEYEANPITSGTQIPLNAADAFRISVQGNVASVNNVVAFERPATISAPYNHVLNNGGTGYEGLESDPDGIADSGDEAYMGTFGAHNYYFNDSQTSPFGIENIATVGTVTSITQTRVLDMINTETEVAYAEADALYYGTITIRVWLEGWDLNAYNSILSQVIRSSFQFTGVDAA